MSIAQNRIVGTGSSARTRMNKAVMETLEARQLFSSYAINELTLGGEFSEVLALNQAGQVAGSAYNDDNTSANAFLFTDSNDNGLVDAGEILDLGTLGGTSAQGSLLNESGQVAGDSFIAGNAGSHAFLFTDRNLNQQVDAGEMLDLGTLGSNMSTAKLLNNAGQVSGESQDIFGNTRAFLFTDANNNGVVDLGEMADLGTLGGSSASPIAMNESGQIAGNSETGSGDTRAFLYTDGNGNKMVDVGEMLDLGTLGGSSSFVTGMNESGQVIGYSYTAGDAEIHAFVFTDSNNNGQVDVGELLDLGTFGGTLSEASLINNAGQVAGYSTDVDGNSHGFIFTDANNNGQVDAGEVADLGLFGGISSTVTAINEAGQVTGFYDTAEGAQRAFLYTDENGNGLVDAGETDELGTLGGSYSLPTALTEDGRVIGFSSNADDSALFGFIYEDGQMLNLNLAIPADSGWVIDQPMLINEAGDIVGTGYKDGVFSPFLMTEVDTPTEEPATIQDVEDAVRDIVEAGRLRAVWAIPLLATLRVARMQLEAGRPMVARVVLSATQLTVEALHRSRRLSDADYTVLVDLLNEVIAEIV